MSITFKLACFIKNCENKRNKLEIHVMVMISYIKKIRDKH